MSSPRTVVVAGAGIGGLTAAIALARRGFQVSIAEQAERLEAIGAGIQLSPNASRVLIDLGLGERLAPYIIAPRALNVMSARSGRVLARASLGESATKRYGAPYWVIHRGDLHTVLYEAIEATPLIALQLGLRIGDFTVEDNGVVAGGHEGRALIGADGLWSTLRARLGHRGEPQFAQHTAWRALVPAEAVSAAMCAPWVNLWLGRHAHLVHYPVRGGSLVNVVAIMRDTGGNTWSDNRRETGWSAAGDRDEILARFAAGQWHTAARELVGAAQQWQTWPLYDYPPFKPWGTGSVTLLGDAAHPTLPYLAQGAAMAIEDAAVLAQCVAQAPDDAPSALRSYEAKRQRRTARTQIAARRNGAAYHMGGTLRALALMTMRGSGLLRRYDWLYGWKPD